MRSVLYSTTAERAEGFERVLVEAGYGPEVRILEASHTTEADVEASRGCGIVFVDLALGMDASISLCNAIRAIAASVPTLIAILREPEPEQVEPLIAAGANMYFPDDPKALSARTRFLHGAVERRLELERVLRELHEAKDRYARIEREHRAVLEGAPDAVFVYRGDRTVWVNAGFAKLAGYADPKELTGIPLLQLVPERIWPVAVKRVSDRAAGKEGPPLEFPLLRRDGTEVHVWSVGMPTMFEGEPAFVTFVRDLTDQHRLETQLMAADRMASLGRLAASVGHEINNPLTYVIGNLQLAKRALRKSNASADVQGMLDEALEGADRVQRIVEDLRVFSQRQNDARTPVDVRGVLDACLRMTAGELRYRARTAQVVEDVPPVLANEARLAQVITNLLLNAAQAMPEGQADTGTITVSARELPADRVEIRVEDTGVGIAPEHLPHVFEPFFTTKIERGGTGLGLSICKMLVASQGGELELASTLGEGTRVTLILPAAPREEARPRRVARPPITTRRVLLIDDEPRVAELLRDHLRPHDVTIATRGRDALALIASSAPFDVIVCDLMMPELSGADVHERIRQDHPGLEHRIVFMTGGAFTPRTTRFLASVPNPCLEKPFAIERLFDAIEAVITGTPA